MKKTTVTLAPTLECFASAQTVNSKTASHSRLVSTHCGLTMDGRSQSWLTA